MLYIATVHWQSDKWINIQKRYIERYIKVPYKVYGYLDLLLKTEEEKFDYAKIDDSVSHAIKLNFLADKICADAENSNDLIIFLDGDAFPVADIMPVINQHIASKKLIAVRRKEENGEQQPHPCFCVTTVNFWKEIKGDWEEGYMWANNRGQMLTDVGGNMLGKLKEQDINWLPLERTNKTNLHPVLFAIYGNIIYHHGAGFRLPGFRINENYSNSFRARLQRFIKRVIPQKIRYLIPQSIRFNLQAARKSITRNKKISDDIYNNITSNPNFIVETFISDNTISQK